MATKTAVKSRAKIKKRSRYPTPKVPVVNERAVAVALDAMKQTRWLHLSEGVYFYVGEEVRQEIIDSGAEDLREVAGKVKKDCDCCALGACLLSKARLYDDVPLDIREFCDGSGFYWNLPGGSEVHLMLRDVFGPVQCRLIEAAFERGFIFAGGSGSVGAAQEFGSRYKTPRKRFLAIMRNIIHNGGVFKPEEN